MANPEHLERLKKSVLEWNNWRKENKRVLLELSGADLRGDDLTGADLSRANLFEAKLIGANLSAATLIGAKLVRADLSGANLKGARLPSTDLFKADLSGADLKMANLFAAKLLRTNLSGADLSGADLKMAVFSQTYLSMANFSKADLSYTVFGYTDLSEVKGLETINHKGPSSISIDTLYLSQGKIPDIFLRGCGVPEDLITYLPSLLGAAQTIQFYSCFISYSTHDEEFAKRLHSRMRAAQLRVWFAPEDMKGGNKMFDQIDNAIHFHDKLLLVLSEYSMQSEWVCTEIRRALKKEKKEGRRKLFPIRLADFEKIQQWELIDADTGKDLAVEIRSYFIPDFSNWKDHDNFEAAFDKLLRDLKAEEK